MYIWLTENDFKTRYRNHTTSFQHTKHRNSTELSKHIWTLKEKNIDHFILWHILSSRSPYNSTSKRCNLCLKEKLLIIHQPELSSLNKRNEHVSSCHLRNKALLSSNWTKHWISHHAFMQVCKLYKWWLWIFFTIKSPDEWVITKWACRDESIVFFFPYLIHIALYFYVSSTVQQKNQNTDFLYVYLCITLHEAHVLKGSSWDRFLASYNQPDN